MLNFNNFYFNARTVFATVLMVFAKDVIGMRSFWTKEVARYILRTQYKRLSGLDIYELFLHLGRSFAVYAVSCELLCLVALY